MRRESCVLEPLTVAVVDGPFAVDVPLHRVVPLDHVAPLHPLAAAPDGVDGNQYLPLANHRQRNGLLPLLPLPFLPAHAVLLLGVRAALLGVPVLVLIAAGRRAGGVVRVVAVVLGVLGDGVLLRRVVSAVFVVGVRG